MTVALLKNERYNMQNLHILTGLFITWVHLTIYYGLKFTKLMFKKNRATSKNIIHTQR